MTNITPEIETEAAIWAEGTKYTAADILRAYREHLSTAAEPLDIQRFSETVLGIRPGGLAVCTDAADAFVSAGGYVVQEISDEQYAALPARLRRRLDSVRA